MNETIVKITLKNLIDEYRDDGWEMPTTWRGRMEALVAGAIDYDDLHGLCYMLAEYLHPHGVAIEHDAIERLVDALTIHFGNAAVDDPADTPEAVALVGLGALADALQPKTWAGRMREVAAGWLEANDAMAQYAEMRCVLYANGWAGRSDDEIERSLELLDLWAGPIDSPNARRLIDLGDYCDQLLAAAK